MQIAGIMVTNNGTHSPYKWASMTVSQILQIDPAADDEVLRAGRKLESDLIAILETAHKETRECECGELKKGNQHLNNPLDPHEHLEIDDVVKQIIKAAVATPFKDHFLKTETQDYIKRVVLQHTASLMNVERSAHADKHPNCPHATKFRNRRVGKAV